MATLGLLTAFLSMRWSSSDLVFLGLSSALITSVVSLMIAVFHWSPSEAKFPVRMVLAMSAVVLAIWGPRSALRVTRLHSISDSEDPLHGNSSFRFSILSLLVLITITGLLIRVLQLIQFGNEMSMFAAYGLSVLVLSISLLIWYGYRRYRQGRAHFPTW